MATDDSEDPPVSPPLIFNDPVLTAEMARLRDKICDLQGSKGDYQLCGLKPGDDGYWVAELEPADPAARSPGAVLTVLIGSGPQR